MALAAIAASTALAALLENVQGHLRCQRLTGCGHAVLGNDL